MDHPPTVFPQVLRWRHRQASTLLEAMFRHCFLGQRNTLRLTYLAFVPGESSVATDPESDKLQTSRDHPRTSKTLQMGFTGSFLGVNCTVGLGGWMLTAHNQLTFEMPRWLEYPIFCNLLCMYIYIYVHDYISMPYITCHSLTLWLSSRWDPGCEGIQQYPMHHLVMHSCAQCHNFTVSKERRVQEGGSVNQRMPKVWPRLDSFFRSGNFNYYSI